MRQMRDKPFCTFAARVHSKADTCAFTVDCTCGLKVNYTDPIIRDTLLNGIADDEIRREIFGNADVLTRAVTSLSAFQRLHDPDHRARRNATPRRESNNLPARSKQSRCPLRQRLYQFYKKGLVVGIPNLMPCVLNAIGHRNVTSLLKWIFYHLN